MPEAAADEGALPICQNSQLNISVRAEASFGMKAPPNFSARYSMIEALSNTRCGGLAEWSISAGILELGFTATKPEPNWSPLPMSMCQASYSASWPASSSSSSRIVTLMPFGVASEYSCRGCLPTGRAASCVAPAMGG